MGRFREHTRFEIYRLWREGIKFRDQLKFRGRIQAEELDGYVRWLNALDHIVEDPGLNRSHLGDFTEPLNAMRGAEPIQLTVLRPVARITLALVTLLRRYPTRDETYTFERTEVSELEYLTFAKEAISADRKLDTLGSAVQIPEVARMAEVDLESAQRFTARMVDDELIYYRLDDEREEFFFFSIEEAVDTLARWRARVKKRPAEPSSVGPSITELTRSDLIELLKGGWSGRLSHGQFLERLYDLATMPSNDRRYKTMAEDVYHHTELNDDWQPEWVFSDERLNLKKDQALLRFITETLHPAVIRSDFDVERRVRELNGILLPDGLEFVRSGEMSGRPLFTVRQTTPRRSPQGAFSSSLISGIAKALAEPYTHTDIDTMFEDQDFPRPSDFGNNKVEKVKAWLRTADQATSFDQWAGLARVLATVLEPSAPEGSLLLTAQQAIRTLLGRAEIGYLPGGALTTGTVPTDAAPLRLPDTSIAPPADWKKLGQGGFGTVYAIPDHRLGIEFALKVFDPSPFNGPDAHERFLREARILFRLRHDHIVRIFDFGSLPDGRPYIRMERFNGGTLQAFLDGRPLTVSEGVDVVGRLASALEHAHEQSIYHRDMKPSNVLVSPSLDQLRLIDFGLGTLIEEGVTRARLTTSANQFGGAYSAPELLANPKILGPELDVYSLGAIWFHLVTMRPPHGTGLDAAIDASSTDRSLKALLRQSLSSAPRERPSARSLRDELRAWRRTYKGPQK